MIEELRKQKSDLIGWYIVTKDKAIRKAIRQLDKDIKKGLEHGTKIHSRATRAIKTSTIG